MGSAFIATEEANAIQAIVDNSSEDIVYSSLFTGVHGNYLGTSIEAAGLDPDNLATGDAADMSFGSSSSDSKAWKDIWGCGQWIGTVKDVLPVAQLVQHLRAEYQAARDGVLAA